MTSNNGDNKKIYSNNIINGYNYYTTISPKNIENNLLGEHTAIINMLKDDIRYGMEEFHLWREQYSEGAKGYHYHGWFKAKNGYKLNKAFYKMMMSKEYRIFNTLIKKAEVNTDYISKENQKVLEWNATTKIFNIIIK